MSTTADRLLRPSSEPSPTRPSHAVQIGPDAKLKLLHGEVDTFDVRDASQTPASPGASATLSFSADTEGEVLVTDLVGGVYGVGSTPDAALRDYFDSLDDRLRRLRDRRAVLHPRLARQLSELEALFPGR